MTDTQLLKKFFSQDRLALSRMISRAENDQSISDPLLNQVFKAVKGAHRIGITGPPGAGKSTLVDGLIAGFRENDKTTGIVAVDPTSPFTGGALLGDRVRMNSMFGDPGVFIRSMASRGSFGGMAHATQEVADVMDAFGYDVVLMETVGVGQSELDIMEAADTVVVVLVPASGDSIQAMKAGLMEIGDIFVLNKSDSENAEQAYIEINSVLSMNPVKNEWRLPIMKTIAHKNQGLDQLLEKINSHREYLQTEGRLVEKQRKRIEKRLRMKIDRKLRNEFWDKARSKQYDDLVDDIYKGVLTYNEAIERLF